MAFWWVNHKQTYSAEVGGGYIWSPKTNRNGSKNQTYINLTLTRPGDVVISYAGGFIKASTLEFTKKLQLSKARIGQGLFRSRLEKIEHACRVTGVCNQALLIASHIKPWSESDNAERLDGNNGLLLSPHIDKLFDRGWITFTDAGDLLCADPCIEQALQQWGIVLPKNVGPFSPKQAAFFEYHRDEIFRAYPILSD
ncbi:TPA: HNH endonuclease [Aeromonas hydrophila]|uniref:HNH endonuclease n=1 Tax=Aeromonas hydrophila TaxID=644 RepID=UPI0038D21516